MSGFACGLDEGWARDRLQEALAGPAPMRCFEDALGFFPEERSRWLACREGRLLALLRAWLEANEIEAVGEPRRGRRQGDVR